MKLTFDEMYEIIGKKDSRYEGYFITLVKTTGIFCRPSCRARKPLSKNVEFLKDPSDALKKGYRPCKICKPLSKENETPSEISQLIEEIQEKPFQKISDQNLKQRKLEPSHIRRWFKKNHNMTFQAYQRLIRINTGFHQIKKGISVTESAFDAGYESLSGFYDGFKTIFGDSPNKTNKITIYLDRVTTKLGPMFIAATDLGLCLLEFTDRRMLERELIDLRKRFCGVIVPGTNKFIKQTKKELSEYFKGERNQFTVPLDLAGTEFQKKIWLELIKIPFGETVCYQDQATKLGNPKAVRAVANANGMNKISIIIPCHRVIGKDGKLVGYGGGLPRKQWLLDHEQKK